MSHRSAAGIRCPAKPGLKETAVEENIDNPGLIYLSTEMPTWRQLPLSIPRQFSTRGSPHLAFDRDCNRSDASTTT